MTSPGRYLKLQVQYGSDQYELLLSSPKDHDIRVEQVLNEIEKFIKVPKCHQTITYKGQRLDRKPDAKLDDLYIFNNSKLILAGTQAQFHNKYCCPDHEHNSLPQHNNNAVDTEEKTISHENNPTMIKKETHLNPTGFVPEPNKSYEYYTVPYKTDPATLLQKIPFSTS